MFCPKCGDELVESVYAPRCVKGDMELSQNMFRRLNETFILKARLPKDFSFSFEIGGKWFCPSDGTKMTENEGCLKCPDCKSSLNEFVVELVELHPHKR